ncbi:MAG: TrkA C-terminal domain-containing protein, partial [Pseudomonadota bacterium]
VGAVRKGQKVTRPTGQMRIDEGDVVAIFALSEDVPEVERLLQVSIDFF